MIAKPYHTEIRIKVARSQGILNDLRPLNTTVLLEVQGKLVMRNHMTGNAFEASVTFPFKTETVRHLN